VMYDSGEKGPTNSCTLELERPGVVAQPVAS
jgi:hypothetical protein